LEELKPFTVRLESDKDRQHLFGDSPKTAGFRAGHVLLNPGEAVGEHSTKNKEEVIIIFEGTAEVSFDKLPSCAAGKNSITYIPPQTTHNVKNIGKRSLKYIYIVCPTNQ